MHIHQFNSNFYNPNEPDKVYNERKDNDEENQAVPPPEVKAKRRNTEEELHDH